MGLIAESVQRDIVPPHRPTYKGIVRDQPYRQDHKDDHDEKQPNEPSGYIVFFGVGDCRLFFRRFFQ